jgi:uncharacterized iron-regulated membrane protein
MKLSVLTRKVHYWAAIIAALPLVVVIGTGLLLQLKKQLPWVQPPERRGSSKEPTLTLARVLEVCQSVSEAEVRTWADVERMDVRPSRGLIKVTAVNGWEVQIDATSGDVLQVAYRRSDLIEAMHDGSWFHPWAKLWLFFPAAVLLLLLWVSGVYLFWLPIVVKAMRPRRPVTG